MTAHSSAGPTLSFIGSVQQQSHRTTYGTGVGLDLRSHPWFWVQNTNSFLPWHSAPTKGGSNHTGHLEPQAGNTNGSPHAWEKGCPCIMNYHRPHTGPLSLGCSRIVQLLQRADYVKQERPLDMQLGHRLADQTQRDAVVFT